MKYCLLILSLLAFSRAAAQIKVEYPDAGPKALPHTWHGNLRPIGTKGFHEEIDSAALHRADSLVQLGLDQQAYPGCRVLAAWDGRIFYDKSFGYLSYDRLQPVTEETVYDLASLTKVVSTTLAVMKLYEQKKLDLDKTLGDYLSITKGSDKDTIRLRELLLHQAGLKAWIPFYKALLDSTGKPLDSLFRNTWSEQFCVPVAKDLFLRGDYEDSVWKVILNSPLENKGRYVYSDLDFYFLAAVVERVSGQALNRYVATQFYRPMGLHHIGYLPLSFCRLDDIAPTEDETIFRRQVLRGYVHDPGAALFGGVAGHAGVFATAHDVAAIFQMLLAGGKWQGRRFFKPETIRLFSAYSSTLSRRGLGFDKPLPEPNDGGPAGNRCTGFAFGHQGFTGTCAWADPGTGIVFVFLSNRVNPSAENKRINILNTRTTVQDALYEALGYPVDTSRGTLREQQLAGAAH